MASFSRILRSLWPPLWWFRSISSGALFSFLLCVTPDLYAQTTTPLLQSGTFDYTELLIHLPTVQLGPGGARINSSAYIPDPRNTTKIDEVLETLQSGQFSLKNLPVLNNFGVINTTAWFATSIQAPKSGEDSLFFLYFEGTSPDLVDLWIVHSRAGAIFSEHRISGKSYPVEKRDLETNNVALKVDLGADDSAILVWKVQNKGPSIYSMSIEAQKDISSLAQQNGMMIALLIGGLGSLMLLSIFLFNAIRDRTYLFFIVQLACFCLYFFSLHDYGNLYLWRNIPGFDKIAASLALVFGIAATIQVLRLFMATKKNDRTIDKMLFVFIFLMPAAGITSIFWYEFGILITCIASGLAGIVTEIAVLRFVSRDKEKSLPFVTGWTILAVTSLATIAVYLGLQIPGQAMSLFFRADHVGIFSESVLFMLALTNRIQYLRLDKEKAEQKNRLKQDFIANISHEMRTPLNGIIGFSESIAHSEHVGEIKFYNLKIISESERLLFQINQLLDLAKIEAGKLELELKPFSLPQSLAYINSAFSMKAGAKNLDFNLSMDAACPLSLNGDRLRLEQILRNLIDNAIKFTESGAINLSVRVQRQDKRNAVLIFAVQDTGIGIEQDKLDAIMEDFVQADSSITRRYGGTGLGTSIARRLVEAMDGHIEVTSSPGKGAMFSIYIPFAITDPTLIRHRDPTFRADEGLSLQTSPQAFVPHLAPLVPERRWRVLVVDDLDTNRQVLAIHLKTLPVTIDEAESGEQALDQLAIKKYDLVLMDVFMPGMSGHDATRAIRALYGVGIPVIAVTASGFERDIKAAQDAGMNEVLVKPIKRDILLETVLKHLREPDSVTVEQQV